MIDLKTIIESPYSIGVLCLLLSLCIYNVLDTSYTSFIRICMILLLIVIHKKYPNIAIITAIVFIIILLLCKVTIPKKITHVKADPEITQLQTEYQEEKSKGYISDNTESDAALYELNPQFESSSLRSSLPTRYGAFHGYM